jgi:mono/diheme cytochrome c family protein
VGSVRIISIFAAFALLTAAFTPGEAWGESPAGPTDNAKSSPMDLVNRSPKGNLHNPYKDTDANVVSQGETLFRSSCGGCHGGGGGGGMAPPLTKGNWLYGGDDDSLFRLVTLGSTELQKNGYTRKSIGAVVGPMPPMGSIIKDSDDLWKMLAFVRSRYDGDPAYKYGVPASQQ